VNREEDKIISQLLHVGRPNIGNRSRLFERFKRILDNAWLTNHGPFVQEFEQQVAAFLGVKHCIAMCNGTIALELAIRALGLKGNVIIPSLTFIATAHALKWQEITPVFCDIDPNNFCINPDEIERHITTKTTGIIGVHLYGRPCEVEHIQKIADKHKLKVIYDAAHAIGCSHKGKFIGNFGNCEVFSFHATKILNTFEGGAITTNDDDLAKKIRLMQNFGFSGEDSVIYIGTNGKMNEVCAAMGLTNLENFESFVEVNRRNWLFYRDGLLGIPGIKLMHYNDTEQNNYHYVIVEVESEQFGMSRDELKAILVSHNILARRYFYPGCHRMEPYRTLFPDVGRDLPATEAFSEKVLAFPTGTQIGPEQIEKICKLIKNIQKASQA
jgi:dTDP-4-amino-4,6-dideoxygalactose transaminase